MKRNKLLSMLLVLAMSISLCACGGGSESGGESESAGNLEEEVLGEWYDVNTAGRLVLNSDKTLEHFRGNTLSQPGYWTLDGKNLDMNAGTIDDLAIEKEGKGLTLTNDEFTFVKWNDLPKEDLSIGETGGEEIAITLNGIEFTTAFPSSPTFDLYINPVKDLYELQDGMVFAKLNFTVANMSKQEIIVPELELKFDVILDYNNGFCFATHDNSKAFFVSEDEWVIAEEAGGQTGSGVAIQPLQMKTIDVYIPCAEMVATDEESSLNVNVISHYESEVHYYEYSVR